jgi:hypothetical protein
MSKLNIEKEEPNSTTMANKNSIANGIPMNLEEMRLYLQDCYGTPIALRQEGTTSINCPYCLKIHEHTGPPGHYMAGCEMADRYNGSGIVIGQRHYVAGYGYKIYDFKEKKGVNHLLIPEDELSIHEE